MTNPRSFPALWMKTLCEGHPLQVLNLYLPNAVLVATYSDQILQGHAQLIGYFRTFMDKEGLCGKIESVRVQKACKHVHVVSGTYKFAFMQDGSPQSVVARFTYVVVKTLRGLKILNHHSSEMPDPQ
jgi:hypothetical protein